MLGKWSHFLAAEWDVARAGVTFPLLKGSRKWKRRGGQDCCKCSIPSLGPWRSIFITFWTCSFCVQIQFPFPFVTTKWTGDYFDNRLCAANFGASIYSHVIIMIDLFCLQINSRMETPCVNGDVDRIHSVLYDTVMNSRIFFLFGPRLFLRSEHSVRK